MNDAAPALPAAVAWVEALLLGQVATIIANLAVAGVGLALLQGHLVVRDAVRVIVGCFILFGAPVMARALADLAHPSAEAISVPPSPIPPSPIPPSPIPPPPPTNHDPYAGAAVPM